MRLGGRSLSSKRGLPPLKLRRLLEVGELVLGVIQRLDWVVARFHKLSG